MKKKIYIYDFGLDDIKMLESITDKTMCFISEPIILDSDNQVIQLTADYDQGEGSIEFYIIDSTKERPILVNGNKNIIDEKIFKGLQTRFTIEADKPIIIKKDGDVLNTTLDQAKALNKDGLTVSYTAAETGTINITSREVKVKVIFRMYSSSKKPPFLKNVAIKQLERSLIWN